MEPVRPTKYEPFKLFHILIFLTFILSIPALCLSTTWYVVPHAEIPLRTGEGTQYRIIELVPDGTRVELLEDGEKWVKIQTPKGNTGWILKRYLSSSTPLKYVASSLRSQKEDLAAKLSALSGNFKHIEQDRDECRRELSACQELKNKLQSDYSSLREDAADVLRIKQALDDTTYELNIAKQKLASLREENQHLKNNERIKWFLTGGGILLVGWLIGLLMGRNKRRRPSLL